MIKIFERYLPQILTFHLANVKYNALYCSHLKQLLNSTNQSNYVHRNDIIQQYEVDFPRLLHKTNNQYFTMFRSLEERRVVFKDLKSKTRTKSIYLMINKNNTELSTNHVEHLENAINALLDLTAKIDLLNKIHNKPYLLYRYFTVIVSNEKNIFYNFLLTDKISFAEAIPLINKKFTSSMDLSWRTQKELIHSKCIIKTGGSYLLTPIGIELFFTLSQYYWQLSLIASKLHYIKYLESENYYCKFHNQVFKNELILEQHFKSDHRFRCATHNQTYSTYKELRLHSTTVHKLKCNLDQQLFNTKKDKQKHLQAEHTDEPLPETVVKSLYNKLKRISAILLFTNEDEVLIINKTQEINQELQKKKVFTHSNTSKLFIAILILTRTNPRVKRVLTYEQLYLLFKRNVEGVTIDKTIKKMLEVLNFNHTRFRFTTNEYFQFYSKHICQIPDLSFNQLIESSKLLTFLEKMWVKFVNMKQINTSSTYTANKLRIVLPAIFSFIQIIRIWISNQNPRSTIQGLNLSNFCKFVEMIIDGYPHLENDLRKYFVAKDATMIRKYIITNNRHFEELMEEI